MSVRLLDRATADGFGTRYQIKGSAAGESRIKGTLYSPPGSVSDGATVEMFVEVEADALVRYPSLDFGVGPDQDPFFYQGDTALFWSDDSALAWDPPFTGFDFQPKDVELNARGIVARLVGATVNTNATIVLASSGDFVARS